MTRANPMRARYRRIMCFAVRYILLEWWCELVLPKIGLARLALRGRDARFLRIARAFHVLAADLGGLMIKVGQFMSTRMDVLPTEITDELSGLQDEVSPLADEQVASVIRGEFGVEVAEVFADFEFAPVASASLGQAHRARLLEVDAQQIGTEDVIVKVQRPDIEAVVEVDLSALRRVARWLSGVRFIREHADLPGIVEEFAATSMEEIDYLHEAASAERFRDDASEDPRVLAPRVAWERTTGRVLTLTDVTGIKIADHQGIRAAGIDPAEVAGALATSMFDQFFRHGFFHGDPHPGNLFVSPQGSDAGEDIGGGDASDDEGGESADIGWTLTYVDFGMMGEVTDEVRGQVRNLVLAIAAHEPRRIVVGMQDLGMLLPSAGDVELERAMSALFDRFGGIGVTDLQYMDPEVFADFATEFGEVIRSLPFQMPENFLLIIRSVSLLNGLCTSLDPDFDIWRVVQPYMLQLVRSESGGAAQDTAQRAIRTLRTAAALPGRIDEVLTTAERGALAVATPGADRELRSLERASRRTTAAVLFAALFIGGILLRWTDPVWGTVAMGVSIVPLVYALLPTRSRRYRHRAR